jgi:sirohydrochlorin cobaltochelatase
MTDRDHTKAIILCAHGSKDKKYEEDFLELTKKVKKRINTTNIYHCFVETNQPLIKDCIESLWLRYKNIHLFPLMFFDGYHMIKDIKQEVEFQKENKKVNIKLVEKISLKEDLSDIFKEEVSKKIHKGKENILIVSSSKSSMVNLRKLMGGYIKEICNPLGIKKFFFADSDSFSVESLIKSKGDELNVIIHPIFFFEGFLYKMIVRKFKKYKNVKTLRPISQYEKVIDLIADKLKT